MKIEKDNPIIFLGIIWAIFIALQASVMPLIPIDETRYMSVAWEMYYNKSWILPTLNFETYSHKPPILFWLINAVWAITGLEVWGVRVMSGIISFASIPLTYALAKTLFPTQEHIRKFAPFVLMSSPLFFVFGALIMFDFLQAIFVLSALIFLLKIEKTDRIMLWALFGLMVGLGILTKGPVMLVHVIFPALLAPLWAANKDKRQWMSWYMRFIFAIALAAGVALIWALQAAYLGGESFSNEIFWSQSAGRMTQSFAHQKPFWFYVPIMFMAFLPLLLWPHAWKTMIVKNRATESLLQNAGTRFLLCWIVPTFITFSLISGKQIHYLVPELGGFAILITYFITSRQKAEKEWFIPFAVYMALFILVSFAPALLAFTKFGEDPYFASIISAQNTTVSVVFVGIFIVGMLYLKNKFKGNLYGSLMSFVLMNFLLISLFSVQMSYKGYKYYDLKPFANELARYKGRPLATNRPYQGELGFLTTLEQPVEVIQQSHMQEWFDENPSGVIIYRYNQDEHAPVYNISFEMRYKSRSHLALITK